MGKTAALLAIRSAPMLASVASMVKPGHRSGRGDRLFHAVLHASAFVAPSINPLFLGVLVHGAGPAIQAFGLGFITSSVWDPNPVREQYGALPFIGGTLISSVLALALALALAVAVAVAASASQRRTCRGSSNASTAWIVLAHGIWGERVWACRSSSTLRRRMGAASR